MKIVHIEGRSGKAASCGHNLLAYFMTDCLRIEDGNIIGTETTEQ